MLKKLRNVLKSRKGQGMVEYGILVGGVALVALAAVAILGHKANDLIASTAAILPGAHADDNGAILSGKLIETTGADTGTIQVNATEILANSDTSRLSNNLGLVGLDTLVLDELP